MQEPELGPGTGATSAKCQAGTGATVSTIEPGSHTDSRENTRVEAPGEDRLTKVEALADLTIYQGFFSGGGRI